MNGSLESIDGRQVLRFERRLAHPPAKVWRAITEPEELAGWFPADIQGERKPGAPLRFASGVEGAPAEEGEITEYDPPRLFAYTWGGSLLRWELHPDPAGCLLVFTQTFDRRPFAASYATGWQLCLDALRRVLSGRPDPAAPGQEIAATRAYRSRHEAYAEVFDLLAGTAEPDGDGWLVRFDRLLPYPADEVWTALTATPGGAADGGAGADGGDADGAKAGGAADPGSGGPGVGGPAPAAAAAEHAPAGPVTGLEPGAALAYDSPAGPVRWSLEPGPGGTLVTLTQRLPGDAGAQSRTRALAGWHGRLESLAAEMSGRIGGTPPAALRARYADTPTP